MSEITKRAFASSLKKMLAKRPLEKIRVIDITEDCGVNRQTFYYHFKDIYDLLEWVYTNEATKALGGKKTYETWNQGFKQIFQYILNNKEFTSELSRRLGYNTKYTSELITSLLSDITHEFQESNAIGIQGFGTFEVKKKAERIVINPVTKLRLLVPPKLVLAFKPSPILKDKFKETFPYE